MSGFSCSHNGCMEGCETAGTTCINLSFQNMAPLPLTSAQERVIDRTQPINQGVTADRVVTDRRGLRVWKITFRNPCDCEGYVYLTSEMTLAPELLALLYKTRWEIEKVFDETKTKLQEKKSGRPRPPPRRCRRILCPSFTTSWCSCKMGTSNKGWKTRRKSSAEKTGRTNKKVLWRKPGRRSR